VRMTRWSLLPWDLRGLVHHVVDANVLLGRRPILCAGSVQRSDRTTTNRG